MITVSILCCGLHYRISILAAYWYYLGKCFKILSFGLPSWTSRLIGVGPRWFQWAARIEILWFCKPEMMVQPFTVNCLLLKKCHVLCVLSGSLVIPIQLLRFFFFFFLVWFVSAAPWWELQKQKYYYYYLIVISAVQFVFLLYSMVTQLHIRVHILFLHIIHSPSQVTRRSSQGYPAGSHG